MASFCTVVNDNIQNSKRHANLLWTMSILLFWLFITFSFASKNFFNISQLWQLLVLLVYPNQNLKELWTQKSLKVHIKMIRKFTNPSFRATASDGFSKLIDKIRLPNSSWPQTSWYIHIMPNIKQAYCNCWASLCPNAIKIWSFKWPENVVSD